MKTIAYTLALVALLACAACAVGPTVTSIEARQLSDANRKVEIKYNLTDPDSATVYISVAISTNGGSTYSARNYVTGDIGWVRPGSSRRMVWDARADLGASAVLPNCKARITADDFSGGIYPGQMTYIPAGSFLMGNSNVGDDATYYLAAELPQHSVTLSGYYIGKYEVTRGQYRAFMNAGGYSTQSYWSAAGWSWRVSKSRTQPYYWDAVQNWGSIPGTFTQTDNHPVVGVTYYEAEAFCNWAGGHLPTEAQWERAARWTGTHANVYPWGDVWDQQKCNNLDDSLYPGYQTAPVGSYPSGVSPSGCQDMAGNAAEWCQDWYKSYPGSSSPFDFTNFWRVVRGLSWADNARSSRCAFRSAGAGGPGSYSYVIGFRLAH